jgi:hypothetical protein
VRDLREAHRPGLEIVRHLDLTGDRPLKKRDAVLLARWWHRNGWSATIRRQGRFFAVLASRG